MRVADFQYDLPEQLIAQHPSPERTASRLLVLDGATGDLAHLGFRDLPGLLREGDLLVLNDTRVVPARLHGTKLSGGRVEVLAERVLDETRFLAHVRASKSPRAGSRLRLADGTELEVLGRDDDLFELSVAGGDSVGELLERAGEVPLPPYIRRAPDPGDRERYQTVYARHDGAVAAPTAGLHFDTAMLDALGDNGVETAFVTLTVGAGTFQPVRVDRVEDHPMHAEAVVVSEEVCNKAARARARGGRVVAVGTTSVRALESASATGELRPYAGDTRLFIYPGYRYRSVDALITNFHLPGSTLLMLVCAFAGRENVLGAYREAVAGENRFFSYGDAMFVTPQMSGGGG